jgi:hypothetical protein
MSFNIDSVIKDMGAVIKSSVKDDVGDIKDYADEILLNEKESLKELGAARLTNQISEAVFKSEVEREKKVVEAELMTISIMTKAAAQRAVNAAINVFVDAVMKAI